MGDDEEDLRDAYVGRLLDGRYRLTRRLGAGGMGVVYAAVHEQIGRQVAIKILHPQYASDREVMGRFKNEARASGTLGHPNIVQAIDFGRTADGSPYIAMEMLEGRDLARALAEDGPFSVADAIRVADRVASALDAAHDKGIVHRDIKPENVFVTTSGAVKILDFGIGKFSEGEASVATRTGAIMGSPHYMAPEQVQDSSRADVRTDIYSLGAVLYKMLSGQTLFSHASLPMLVLAITNETPRPLIELREDVPEPLARLVARMLHKKPSERPKSMEEVRTALAAFAGIDGAPRLSGPVPAAGPAQTTPFATEMAASRIVLPTRKSAMGFVVAGLAIAGVAVALAFGGAGTDEAELGEAAELGDGEAAAARATRAGDPVAAPPSAEVAPAVTSDAGPPDAGAAISERAEPAPPREPRASRERSERRDARARRPEMREAPATTAPLSPPAATTMRIDGIPIDDTY